MLLQFQQQNIFNKLIKSLVPQNLINANYASYFMFNIKYLIFSAQLIVNNCYLKLVGEAIRRQGLFFNWFCVMTRQRNEEFLISEVFMSLRDKNAYIRTDFCLKMANIKESYPKIQNS